MREALAALGDIERQRAAWRSGGRVFCPDPVELIERVLDDYDLASFVEVCRMSRSDEAWVVDAASLLDKVSAYPGSRLKEPEAVLADPDWLAITALAADLSRRL